MPRNPLTSVLFVAAPMDVTQDHEVWTPWTMIFRFHVTDTYWNMAISTVIQITHVKFLKMMVVSNLRRSSHTCDEWTWFIVLIFAARPADGEMSHRYIQQDEWYINMPYNLVWSSIQWSAKTYIYPKSRAGSSQPQQHPIVTTRLDLRQSLPRKRPVMTSWLHLPRTPTPHACCSFSFNHFF
jgi:hypothetical protein